MLYFQFLLKLYMCDYDIGRYTNRRQKVKFSIKPFDRVSSDIFDYSINFCYFRK